MEDMYDCKIFELPVGPGIDYRSLECPVPEMGAAEEGDSPDEDQVGRPDPEIVPN